MHPGQYWVFKPHFRLSHTHRVQSPFSRKISRTETSGLYVTETMIESVCLLDDAGQRMLDCMSLPTVLKHQLRLAFQEIRSSFSSQYYFAESLITLEMVDVYLQSIQPY